jgi:hypothetical protein
VACRPAGRLAAPGFVLAACSPAHAHTTGQAFVLLLPTHLYIAGGAVVVLVSFLLLAAVPARLFAAAERLRWRLWAVPGRAAALSTAASLTALAAILVLVAAGLAGSRDPLANPLPLSVWTLWWIGFTYLHALAGNVWAHVNPWHGLHRLLTARPPLRRWRERPPLAYPAALGQWPAVAGLGAFAWLELVHPAPADPAVLARAVALYLAVHLAGVLLFGPRAWLPQAETFSAYFRLIAWLAPVGVEVARAERDQRRAYATLPALRLLEAPAPGPGGIAFVLLALASVSFDGLARTFAWLGLLGVNPLDYPGRTVLIAPNTAGLLLTWTLLALAYALAIAGARRLAGRGSGLVRIGVLAIVPIAFGYHLAHYLPAFLVDAQWGLRALSDPFARGWDLLGTAGWPVSVAPVADPAWIWAIWRTQVAIIVAAHVAAVWIGHALALRATGHPRAALASQVPMLGLMIGYTLFGLWLLATPAAG